MLHIQIPLHDVAAMRILLDISGAKRGQPQQWVGSSEKCTGWKFGPRDSAQQEIRSRQVLHQKEMCRQRQYVKHSEASAHCCLAIVKWVPSKPDSRVKVPKSGVLEQGAT